MNRHATYRTVLEGGAPPSSLTHDDMNFILVKLADDLACECVQITTHDRQRLKRLAESLNCHEAFLALPQEK